MTREHTGRPEDSDQQSLKLSAVGYHAAAKPLQPTGALAAVQHWVGGVLWLGGWAE